VNDGERDDDDDDDDDDDKECFLVGHGARFNHIISLMYHGTFHCWNSWGNFWWMMMTMMTMATSKKLSSHHGNGDGLENTQRRIWAGFC
jgi:hypothetical protein